MVSLLQRVIVHVRKVDHSIQSQIVSMFWRMTWLPTLETSKGIGMRAGLLRTEIQSCVITTTTSIGPSLCVCVLRHTGQQVPTNVKMITPSKSVETDSRATSKYV